MTKTVLLFILDFLGSLGTAKPRTRNSFCPTVLTIRAESPLSFKIQIQVLDVP